MEHVASDMGSYGLVFVFINVLLAELGLPLPLFPILLAAGALATGGGDRLLALIAAGVGGFLTADLAWYWCGKRFGGRVLGWLCKLSLSPDACVRQTETMFLKIGKSSLLFAKFFPALSTLSVAMAGASRIAALPFLLLDATGAFLFMSFALGLGWVFRDQVADILKAAADTGKTGLLGILLLFCLYLLSRWWRRRSFIRALRMDRISVDELHRLIEDGRNPLILDARPKEIGVRDGIIPGSVPADVEDLGSIVTAARHDRDVVVYCACPNEASAAAIAKRLKHAGLRRIHPLFGGIDAWTRAGLPLQHLPSPTALAGSIAPRTKALR
jgi:membrane protein DedA with SNARE-associated domain/rhodanese-related sulfurtransferase